MPFVPRGLRRSNPNPGVSIEQHIINSSPILNDPEAARKMIDKFLSKRKDPRLVDAARKAAS